MKPDEIDVIAKSVYAKDHFELELNHDTGRPTVKHRAPRQNRGALVAVYATAKDMNGVLEVDVVARALFEKLFSSRGLDDKGLAREAESYVTRKMTIRLLGAPPSAVA